MKSFKKILANVFAILLLVVGCFGLSACKEDIVKVELNISVYNYNKDDNDVVIGDENVTLTIDLYRHFAKNTVDTMVKYIKDGYYDGAVFYEIESSFPNQIMMGELLVDGTDIKLNDVKPQISGEFEHGGTSGSNLVAKKGSVGLWRTWTAYNDSYNVSDSMMNSGRATWFLPTNTAQSTLSGYNGWFCIFGQFDLSGDNAKALELIQAALDEQVTQYVIYYTGEYDENKPNENFGLTSNIMLADAFEEDNIKDLFVAEGEQPVCYNHYTVNIPIAGENGPVTAKITSAKVVK